MIEVKIDAGRTQVEAKGASSELRTEVAFMVLAGARMMHQMDKTNGINYYKELVRSIIADPILEDYARDESGYSECSSIDLRELRRQMQQGGDTDA